MTDTTQAMRDAFESDWLGIGPTSAHALARSGESYKYSATAIAWATWQRAWQAALSDPCPPSAPSGDAETVRKAAAYDALSAPEVSDFLAAVENEALHQRDRWAASGDAGKTDADWFWLVGYLSGKAINKPEKQLHHIITTAAACLNWHGARTGHYILMRPGHGDGIDPAALVSPNHGASE